MNFCVVILILKMEEKSNIFSIVLCYFKKGKNATETQKERFEQCMEKVLWLIEYVKSGLWSLVPKISHWIILHDE